MTIHAVYNHMQLENVIVDYRDRPQGSVSKLNTFSDGFKVLKTILRLFKNYKPMAFFSMIAAVLLALAIGFFIPVFIRFLETHLVLQIPTLVVCGFATLAALQSFFAGLILSNMSEKNRRDFEYELHRTAQDFKRKKQEN